MTLQRYAEFAPTQFDSRGAFLPDREEWLVGPCSRTRDSDTLTESNFASLLEILGKTDPEGDNWEVHRFGHWGPGWFEIVLIKPETPAAERAEEVTRALEDYPVLNEDDYSIREFEAACEAWGHTSIADRIEVCAKHGVSVFAARRNEIPQGLPYFDDFYR